MTSRFANVFLKDLFYYILVIRPVFIIIYTSLNSFCSIKQSFYIIRSLRREKLQLKDNKKLKRREQKAESEDSDVDVAFGS
jgi:hypothetical protein